MPTRPEIGLGTISSTGVIQLPVVIFIPHPPSSSTLMSYSSKPKFLTYPEATRAFANEDVREDINDACARLGQAMSKMMDRFDSVAKQMHTLDLQRLAAPLKPRWDALSKV
jgi:hypothetical protein